MFGALIESSGAQPWELCIRHMYPDVLAAVWDGAIAITDMPRTPVLGPCQPRRPASTVWYSGAAARMPPPHSPNAILINHGPEEELEELQAHFEFYGHGHAAVSLSPFCLLLRHDLRSGQSTGHSRAVRQGN